MNLWFDPAVWRKRTGAPTDKCDRAARDTATVATGMPQDESAEVEASPGMAPTPGAEGLSVATVAVSQAVTSAETAVLMRDDILERAAILEYCEGLPREAADVLALAEFDCILWGLDSK